MNNEITLNDSNTFDAGEVVDNERGCFNARCCFKIKNAAPRAVVFVLLFDLALFTVVWITIGLVIASTVKKYKQFDGPFDRVIVNSLGIYLPCYFLFIMKNYYIIRWFKHGKQRKHFFAVHRFSITYCCSLFLYSCMNLAVTNGSVDVLGKVGTFSRIINIIGMVISVWEIVFMEVFIRYQDKLHFAKNDLKRDQIIL